MEISFSAKESKRHVAGASPVIGRICWRQACSNLKSVKVGWQTAVCAKKPLVHHSGNREVLEDVVEHVPRQRIVVRPEAMVARLREAVSFGGPAVHSAPLVITSEQEVGVGVASLEQQEEANHVELVVAAIHVAAEEEHAGL